ncbi:unnamed protein product, partial [Polarella glacialis]
VMMLLAEAEVLASLDEQRQALASAQEAISISRQVVDPSLECYALYKVCFDAHLQLRQEDEALDVLMEAWEIRRGLRSSGDESSRRVAAK